MVKTLFALVMVVSDMVRILHDVNGSDGDLLDRAPHRYTKS